MQPGASGARTILILGGGIGGVAASVTLQKRLSREHRIVLVDRQGDHLFPPSLLWMITGHRSANP